MTKDEALSLALDWFICYQNKSMSRNNAEALTDEAITAIKEALAQPEQEPVALTVYRGELCYKSQEDDQSFGMWCPVTPDYPSFLEGTKFYTTPPQRKPQIWEHEGYDALCQELELWKAEAQRKPLTDRQVERLYRNIETSRQQDARSFEAFKRLLRVIEAAHGIKE